MVAAADTEVDSQYTPLRQDRLPQQVATATGPASRNALKTAQSLATALRCNQRQTPNLHDSVSSQLPSAHKDKGAAELLALMHHS
jgi:cytochrome c-type biogenesis protein CcmH/NrfF